MDCDAGRELSELSGHLRDEWGLKIEHWQGRRFQAKLKRRPGQSVAVHDLTTFQRRARNYLLVTGVGMF